MALDMTLQKSAEWNNFINSIIGSLETTASTRRRVSLGLLHLALEHFGAIHTLLDSNHPGSALALIRPQFEAFIRGTWYWHVASDEQIAHFTSGNQPPRIDQLLNDLDQFQGYSPGNLVAVKMQVWDAMNDYTHGGSLQALGRNSEHEIGSNYPDEMLVGLLDTSANLALLSALVFAEAVDSVDASTRLVEKHRELYGNGA